jgi:hypothetical protein
MAPADAKIAVRLHGEIRLAAEHARDRRSIAPEERALEGRVAREPRRGVVGRDELVLVGRERGT